MKTWNNPEIVELNINETAQGGNSPVNIDGHWTDQNGNHWASFSSGRGGEEHPPIVVN